MSLSPLQHQEIRPDPLINATATSHQAQAPTGISTVSTLSAPDQPQGCCFGIVNKVKNLFLWIRNWIVSWFRPSQEPGNMTLATPSNGQTNHGSSVQPAPNANVQPYPVNNVQTSPLINNLQPAQVPQANAAVNNPQLVPANINRRPHPNWMNQKIETKHAMPRLLDVWELLRQTKPHIIAIPPIGAPGAIVRERREIEARLVAMFNSFPDEVEKRNIMNRMEALKRAADPGIVLADNWAERLIRGENGPAPIATPEEMNILSENSLFGRAIADYVQQLGEEPDQILMALLQDLNTLTHLRTEICYLDLLLYIRPDGGFAGAPQVRAAIVASFNELPQEFQILIKNKMIEIAEPEMAEDRRLEMRQIFDWAGRVIRGETRIAGEAEGSISIPEYVDILSPGNLLLRAITDVINATPVQE